MGVILAAPTLPGEAADRLWVVPGRLSPVIGRRQRPVDPLLRDGDPHAAPVCRSCQASFVLAPVSGDLEEGASSTGFDQASTCPRSQGGHVLGLLASASVSPLGDEGLSNERGAAGCSL